MTSPIVINMPTRELLADETKNSFVERFEHLTNKNNVCKQISSPFCQMFDFHFISALISSTCREGHFAISRLISLASEDE